jgi:hypothetical protein
LERWPDITEPLLRERQAMSDEQFFEFLAGLLDSVGTRTLDDAHYQQAIGYPWDRRPGSCLVTDGHVEDLVAMDPARRDDLLREYSEAEDRVALLAYGANVSPERLALKFGHLPEGHRRALILAGELDDFDVAATAQPPLFSSMPATLVPSPGTRITAAVLFCDQLQFTTLWWTELSYRVGALEIRFRADVGDASVTQALAFISRYGAFCIDGAPAVMSAITAVGRRWPAYTQEEVMAAAGRLVLGSDAGAWDLVKAAYERPKAFFAAHLQDFRSLSLPFDSPGWTLLPLRQ